MIAGISGFCQPAEELGRFTFAYNYLFGEGHIQVEGKLAREETGNINNGFATNQELAVRPEEGISA